MTTRRAARVATALAAAVLVIVVTVFVKHAGAQRDFIVISAQFEDAVGLYVGNAVSVLGMPVGQVTAIVPNDTYVTVTMSVDRKVPVPADVQAVTVSTSVLTDRHVELTPAYHDGPRLRDGDTLSLNRTRTPVEFDKTLMMIDKLSRSLNGDGAGQGPLADLVGIGAKIATGSGADLKTTLARLSEALHLGADSGVQTKHSIEHIAANLADLVQTAKDNDTAIRQFGANLHQITDVLADENLGTGGTGAKLNDTLADITSLLEANRERLRDTLGNTQTLTNTIMDNRRGLAETLDLAPLALQNLNNAIDVNAGSFRAHLLIDKDLFNGQYTKELCNLLGLRQLGCATGALQDYGPDFGLTRMLDLMAEAK